MMDIEVSKQISGLYVSDHAQLRMSQRAIKARDLELVFKFGRRFHKDGIEGRVVGKKEVRKAMKKGVDLRRVDGIHVIFADGCIVTTYRNHNLNTRGARRGYNAIRSRTSRRARFAPQS